MTTIINGSSPSVTFSDGTTQTTAGLTGSTSQLVKAWVEFAGSSSGATINQSFNVSSVTRSGVGAYTVNIANAFSNPNPCALAATNNPGYNIGAVNIASTSTNTVNLNISGITGSTNAALDATIVSVLVIGS
jgi:hypothetical protein